ncbi:MAG: sodium:solute symporter family protein [Kiritimatiellae bacterium]|jgi:SSS family solute:Na+ symporter|nr:sodium:solute symporter family protein [Kiritimatiellia bacterium]
MQNSIVVTEYLQAADWLVFAGVLLLTVGVVMYGNVRRRLLPASVEDAKLLDLLLMGRRLTLPLFTGTLVATWYGGILSVTEYAFDYGLYSWVTQGVFWYVAYLIFAFCLVRRIRETRARTMPDMLEKLFGPRSGKLGAWLNLFNVLPVMYVLSLGLFLQMVLGGNLIVWMVLGTATVVAYSTFGGFRSVVFSDMVQFGVMCTAVALVIAFSMHSYGGIGWLRTVGSIPATHWNPFHNGISIGSTLVWGFVALGTLVDPNFYQRCLAAKDARTAMRGILLATLVWVGFDFCTTFGAFYARAVLPEASSATAYLTYSVQLLPPGLRGFFLAGILATILSTLDSYLFLSGTVVAYDLAPSRFKGSIRFHHLGTLGVAVLAVGLTQLFHEANLVDIWKFFGGFSTACLLVPLMVGYLFPGKLKDGQFVCSSLGGALSMIVFRLVRTFLDLPEFWQTFEPFYFGLLGSVIGLGMARLWR